MTAITLRVYGKLNLTLEVLGRRSDGYHDVATVLQSVSVSDTLVFRVAPSLSIQCTDKSLEREENLAYQAARLFQRTKDGALGVEISIEKGIPVASGMGGGSADAAATLVALNRLWRLRIDDVALSQMAASLGSDVPFFLTGGTALATGRGERVARLPAAPERWFLIVRPAVEISSKTARAYSYLSQSHWTKGRASFQLADALRNRSPIRETSLGNVFDAVVPSAYPEVGRWRSLLLDVAPSPPHLAGAGPSLYVPIVDKVEGERIMTQLPQEDGVIMLIARTVPRSIEALSEEA